MKAFTLFSALVAFLMAIVAIMLTGTMKKTESNIIKILNDVKEEDDMATVFETVRQDALQNFNISLRLAISDQILSPSPEGNPKDITTILNTIEFSPERTIKEIQETFFGVNECTLDPSQFSSSQNQDPIKEAKFNTFIDYIKQKMLNLLPDEFQIRRFVVKIKKNDSTRRNNLKEAIKAAIDINFMTPVCNEENPFSYLSNQPQNVDCDGSFYANFDFSKVEDSIYENLPTVQVKTIAGEEKSVEAPILPHSRYRVLFPARFFTIILYMYELKKSISPCRNSGQNTNLKNYIKQQVKAFLENHSNKYYITNDPQNIGICIIHQGGDCANSANEPYIEVIQRNTTQNNGKQYEIVLRFMEKDPNRIISWLETTSSKGKTTYKRITQKYYIFSFRITCSQ